MKQTIIGFGVLALFLIAAAFLLPWRNVNWGKISFIPAELISVTGEAKSQQKNQIASFTAGVNIFNDKKEVAVDEVNKKINELIDSVKKFGIPTEDIKTQNMSVYQQQDPMMPGQKRPTTQGQWVVNNSIEITLRDADKAQELADLLNSSGANNVYGPNFRMDDTNKIENTLFDGAMKDARKKAELIAKASGRKLGKVMSVSEGSGGSNIYPMYDMKAAVEPGSATVSKSLNVSFELE
ncbi:MAG: SIMPL domain-containing protein [Candidatus Shapirobacteria bacterium]|nr:SIMPL domain-containing protein [Candidatus Shapirobacteria bacterium]